MDKANELIYKIFDINNSVAKLSEAAENEKRDADDEHNKKIAEFDKKLAEEYKQKYENGILEIENEINNEIETFYIEHKKEMKELETRKNEKKDVWVNEIIKDITGV